MVSVAGTRVLEIGLSKLAAASQHEPLHLTGGRSQAGEQDLLAAEARAKMASSLYMSCCVDGIGRSRQSSSVLGVLSCRGEDPSYIVSS